MPEGFTRRRREYIYAISFPALGRLGIRKTGVPVRTAHYICNRIILQIKKAGRA